jgi:hypothetical protein
MKRPILFAYQLAIGLSDASTGALLIVVPAFTLQLMGLHVAADALPYLSFIGSFVLAVGFCCLYGAYLAWCGACSSKLRLIWLLTAILRSSVAIFLLMQVLSRTLEAGWLTVAVFDGVCALIQANGLRKGWLVDAAK